MKTVITLPGDEGMNGNDKNENAGAYGGRKIAPLSEEAASVASRWEALGSDGRVVVKAAIIQEEILLKSGGRSITPKKAVSASIVRKGNVIYTQFAGKK